MAAAQKRFPDRDIPAHLSVKLGFGLLDRIFDRTVARLPVTSFIDCWRGPGLQPYFAKLCAFFARTPTVLPTLLSFAARQIHAMALYSHIRDLRWDLHSSLFPLGGVVCTCR